MQHSDNGAAPPVNRLSHRTIPDVFLDTMPGAGEEFVPLTPSMIHIWHWHKVARDASSEQNHKDSERFVYSFYDAFHQLRAPHRLPAPPKTLAWLNQPALDVSSGFKGHANAPPASKYYLTRYMLH